MRTSHSLVFSLALVTIGSFSSGCIVVHDHNNDRPVVTCNVPGPTTYSQNFPLFKVLANASTAIAAGDAGFAVTSNGAGTYRVSYSDTANLSTCFNGRITRTNSFNSNQVTGFSGFESIEIIAPNQIGFASNPGANVDGVDFFADNDTVYVDVFADNSPSVNIYYTDGPTGAITTTGANPAAFISP